MADIVRKKRERPSDNEAEGDLDANKAKRVKLADPAVLWQGYVGMVCTRATASLMLL